MGDQGSRRPHEFTRGSASFVAKPTFPRTRIPLACPAEASALVLKGLIGGGGRVASDGGTSLHLN